MIGIFGGGQLSVFLIEAAHRLGLATRVLLTDRQEPAARVSDEFLIDDGKPETFARFFNDLEVVLFESENIDLTRFEKIIPSTVRTVPSLDAMRTLQNKASQKSLLQALEIPSARFAMVSSSDLDRAVEELRHEFSEGWILKRARGGYDGKGNYLGADEESAKLFLAAARKDGIDVYAEERVQIRRELAIVLTRTRGEATVAYPVVASTQTKGVCDFVEGPASELGLSAESEAKIVAIGKAIGDVTRFVGTFAVELFETIDGDILVNEIAPRVHNSGHYTLDAARTSQFEQHLRAALNLSLGSVETEPYFRMKNCLGPAGVSVDRGELAPRSETSGRIRFHDYGKASIRPGRKMGHLTISGSPAERIDCVRALEAAHAKWVAGLSSNRPSPLFSGLLQSGS